MKRLIGFLVGLALVLTVAAPAAAASAFISPSSQSHGHGVASNWTLSWGATSPFHVEFYFGDGIVDVWQNVSITGSGDSYTFYPCSTTNFHQTLKAWDGWNNTTHTFKGFATDTSTSQENGGPC